MFPSPTLVQKIVSNLLITSQMKLDEKILPSVVLSCRLLSAKTFLDKMRVSLSPSPCVSVMMLWLRLRTITRVTVCPDATNRLLTAMNWSQDLL